jgi:EAL domain-containing protein (putative c-di-GMP-specific phosphodiesterase class I)
MTSETTGALRRTPADFARARHAGEFRLHYQVQVDRAGRPVAAEALLRWQRGDRLVPPCDFLPLLEASAEISYVGEWILRSACRQAAEWRRQGAMLARIAVNVSPRQLDPHLVVLVADALRESGLAPSQLELEVTESCVMQRIEDARWVLRQLKELGLRIAMDDFGTGYSSLSNLYRLPFDVVKIDRSFTMDLFENPRAQSVTRAILALGRELGLEIVAEGIETADQYSYLLREGCDIFQGYYFGRPTAPDQLCSAIAPRPGMARAVGIQ